MAMNRIRTEVSGRKASKYQVSGSEGLLEVAVPSLLRVLMLTLCGSRSFSVLSLREQSPASNPPGMAPTSQGVAVTSSGCI